MPLRKWVESANYAIEGILHAIKTQRHLRYHFYAAVMALLLSFILGVNRFEFIAVAILVIIVLSAEMMNTAIEATVDIIFSGYDKKAKIIKDIAAGAVLITAIGAAVIGYLILIPHFTSIFHSGLRIARQSEDNVAIISLVIVLILVIITKAFFGKGTPLRGGLPSGHAAVAFSSWVTITLISESVIVSLLVLILAILIAQSRVSTGIHKPWEVILGALFGSVITFLLFKLFI